MVTINSGIHREQNTHIMHDVFVRKSFKNKFLTKEETITKYHAHPLRIRIRLLPEEKLLCVQRQHWIVLVFNFLFHLLLIGIILLILIGLLYLRAPDVVFKITTGIGLLSLSAMALIGIYTYLSWFYEFFIITNKRLIKAHLFRILGVNYEEFFHSSDVEIELHHLTSNFLYDFLNIADIVVHFRNLARIEPFVFNLPENHDEIVKIMDELSAGGKNLSV